jgi:predicted ester cyclase
MKKLLFLFITVIPQALLLCHTSGCRKPVKGGITEEEARGIIEGFIKFRNEGDLASADRVMHPECMIRYPNLPQEIVGLDAYREYDRMTRVAFPDFKMTIDDFFVSS